MAQSIEKSENRERKNHKGRHGMQSDGGSVKVLANVIQNKAEKARKNRKSKKGGK
jgi:hypothetical protein